jgi:NTP pyrophosphatase (non-canonical NTP hydrolase)
MSTDDENDRQDPDARDGLSATEAWSADRRSVDHPIIDSAPPPAYDIAAAMAAPREHPEGCECALCCSPRLVREASNGYKHGEAPEHEAPVEPDTEREFEPVAWVEFEGPSHTLSPRDPQPSTPFDDMQAMMAGHEPGANVIVLGAKPAADIEKWNYIAVGLTALADDVYESAVERGLWDCGTCDGTGAVFTERAKLTDLGTREIVDVVCPVCAGEGKHRDPAVLLALAHAELSEAVEALRSAGEDAFCDKCDGLGGEFLEGEWAACGKCALGDTGQNSGQAIGGSRFAEELADALMLILNISGGLDIDIAAAVIEKHAYNRTRPRMHGKAF